MRCWVIAAIRETDVVVGVEIDEVRLYGRADAI